MEIQLHKIISDEKCFETVRVLRWQEGVNCPHCSSKSISKNGKDDKQPHCQRYVCRDCKKRFDDLTDTIFSGSHYPLTTWISCLYLMSLNQSNAQIAKELDLSESSAFELCSRIREGVVKKTVAHLSGTVEFDECYVVAGQKGQPVKVKQKERSSRRRRLKGKRGRGTSKDEKNPIFGMIQRGGQVILSVLDNVQQRTIQPIIVANVLSQTEVHTDEYNIYNRLSEGVTNTK